MRPERWQEVKDLFHEAKQRAALAGMGMWSLLRARHSRGSIASKFRPRNGFSFER